MTPLPRPLRSPRTLRALALPALLTSLAACGSSPKDTSFLGPIDAGSGAPETSTDQASPPPVTELATSSCASGTLVGQDTATVLRSVGLAANRGVLVTERGVEAWEVDDSGCPLARAATFGDGGQVDMPALGAAALPDGRALVVTADKAQLLSAAGQPVAECQLAGQALIARGVSVGGDGNAVAWFARSPLFALHASAASCDVSAVQLSPAPFVVAAATTSSGGWITVEQSVAASPLAVAWYDASGQRARTSEAWSADGDPGHLCSATAVAEAQGRVLVADSVCERVVEFDATTGNPTGYAAFDGTPRGVGIAKNGSALVAVARVVDDGAVATFETIAAW